MPVLIPLEETNPQFQIPPSTENIRCAELGVDICLTNHYAADNSRLLMYLTGYHDDNQPTAMTVRKMNSTSI